jgi:PKD repeat protein
MRRSGFIKRAMVVAGLMVTACQVNSQCNADFTFSINTTTVNFVSTSTGTSSSTNHNWYFSDGNPGLSTATSGSMTHVFPYNGNYSVWLGISDSTCTDSVTKSFTITGGTVCNISSAYSYSYGTGGTVNFSSTSTGTNSSTAYLWNFGGLATSTLSNPSFTFPTNGNYSVSLKVYDSMAPFVCQSTSSQTVTVSGATVCPLNASYTFTVGSGGNLTVTSTSTGTNSNTWVYWDFGDGSPYTGGVTTSHSYSTAGTFKVWMQVIDTTNTACKDTMSKFITIGGTVCPVSASFYLWKDSSVAGLWHAVPNYPGTISGATWSWGDGSSSNGLYPTHTYSATGFYNICLTVSVTCGSSTTTCVYSNIYKPSGSLSFAGIQVDNTTQAINNHPSEPIAFRLYPNPSPGDLTIDMKGISGNDLQIEVIDLLGETVFRSTKTIRNPQQKEKLDLTKLSEGTYFLRLSSGEKSQTVKVVITK